MDQEKESTSKAPEANEPAERKGRGFAAMPRDRQRELATRGGRAAHANGKAHEFAGDEAREAGRKGGQAVSRDREYMAKIGREGARKSAIVRGRRRRGAVEEASATAPVAASVSDAPPAR
jgi:general stress protein YciG